MTIKVLEIKHEVNDNDDIVIEAKCNVDDRVEYFTLVESYGIPTYLKTEESIFNKLMDCTLDDDDELNEYIINSSLMHVDGIVLGEYSDCLDSLQESNAPLSKLILILITAIKWDEGIIEIAEGHNVEDIELEYLDPDEF